MPVIWAVALRYHLDEAFGSFLLRELTRGFRIGFQPTSPLQGVSQNMLSVLQHPEVVQSYLKNCTLQWILGPVLPEVAAALSRLHINQFGVIPKGHSMGKW